VNEGGFCAAAIAGRRRRPISVIVTENLMLKLLL
jgi:hypothetical protein